VTTSWTGRIGVAIQIGSYENKNIHQRRSEPTAKIIFPEQSCSGVIDVESLQKL